MTHREATLMEVLQNREQRVLRQRELLAAYGKPLICFTMNIPGPVKNNFWIREGFLLGKRQLLALLASANIPVLHQEEISTVTGCEGFFVVDAPARQVKELAVRLEDSLPAGRLYDMDVITTAGEKVSRQELGMSDRTCLICGKPARVCGPVRAHSAGELSQKAQEILFAAVSDCFASKIGILAAKSLLYEVCTTPKPGLVDRNNSGSHRDMDIFTFLGSSAVLQPYFIRCAETGIRTRMEAPVETLRQLRLAGRLAEQDMYRETNGVNTHKGAIFTMGLACAAAGRLIEGFYADPAAVLSECAAMTAGITQSDFQIVTPETARTAGERLYALHGITGIRGQAEAGFPAVLHRGLPVLREGLSRGYSPDRAGSAALLALMVSAEDTNLIARSDYETQRQLCRETEAFLAKNPYPDAEQLTALDQEFIRRNLSPGGSADLLALCFFLHFLERDSK